MSVLFTIGVLALIGLAGAVVHGRLLRLRAQVKHRWQQVDAQRKRRHALVPPFVSAVRAAGAFDDAALVALEECCARAADARGPVRAGRAESELSVAVARVVAGIDAPPARDGQSGGDPPADDLRGDRRAALAAHGAEVAAAADDIARACAPYNATAAQYNAAIDAAPGNLVAIMVGFRRADPCLLE